MSLFPAAPRPRTVFEAISDLAASQYENHQLLHELATNQTATTTSNASLMTTLTQLQSAHTQILATLATTQTAVTAITQQIADAATYWQKNLAGKPYPVKVEGHVHTEIEERLILAETPRIMPGPMLALLTPLHRIEERLADIGIAENRPARDKAAAAYQEAVQAFDEHIAAHRHLKSLKPQLKALTLKLPAEGKEAIEAELLEKLRILHAISAGAVALQAAHIP